ncbi:hypothetical protein PPYR_08317 [Photinus pyralis]|uniref:N-acetyltransferase domain-containing protein n=1 Tax=Photinus pyralis TaxID=7054 RepID=A0A1Y1MRC9_PHOPY|nr:uncharacterized protein LOC116172412 [Photinus pyralis]KAB0797323.1 hypothetical protein PPYR_08317 [Photinus pyralis]
MEEVNCKWKRPSSAPYPSIYKKFEGRRPINGVIPKFWVQDIPEDQFDAAVEFMMGGFPYDEPLNKYSKLESDSESMNTLRMFLKEMLKDKLGLICYAENPDPKGKPIIAGVNVTHIKTKDDENIVEIKGNTLSRIFETMEVVTNIKNVFDTFNVNACLNAMGLYVSNEFRGQGIGLEILKAREDLCKAVGISVIVTVFTATPSQIIAERAGYKTLSQISYSDLKRLGPKHTFPGINEHTEALKYMYKII